MTITMTVMLDDDIVDDDSVAKLHKLHLDIWPNKPKKTKFFWQTKNV